jgi:hypothetical protein
VGQVSHSSGSSLTMSEEERSSIDTISFSTFCCSLRIDLRRKSLPHTASSRSTWRLRQRREQVCWPGFLSYDLSRSSTTQLLQTAYQHTPSQRSRALVCGTDSYTLITQISQMRRCFTSVLYPRSIRARALKGPATIRFRVVAIEPWAVRSSKLSSPVHTGIVCPQSPSARAPESFGRTPCPRYAQQDLRLAISIPARWGRYRHRRFAGAH